MKQLQTVKMQYEPEVEQTAMMGISYTPTTKPLSVTKNPQVQETRKILMILIGVVLALSVGSITIDAIVVSGIEKYTGHSQRGELIGEAVFALLFDGFGLFIAYKYSATGLRVFAWLSIIVLVLSSIGIGLLLFVSITALIAMDYANDELTKAAITGISIGSSILIIRGIIEFVLTVVIVSFAFKLARLIDANKHITTQQI